MRLNKTVISFVGAAVLAAAVPSSAATFTIFNTGVNDLGQPIAHNQVDTHYSITPPSANGPASRSTSASRARW